VVTVSAPGDRMNVKEVCDFLDLSESTVLRLAAAGDIPGARIGRQWRFSRSVLSQMLEGK
jgi:excisionase family DNA binding protein